MGISIIDDKLKSELMMAGISLLKKPEEVYSFLNNFDISLISEEAFLEIYNYFLATLESNPIVLGYLKQVVQYAFIYDVTHGVTYNVISVEELMRKFREDKDFALSLIRKFYNVLFDKSFYEVRFATLTEEQRCIYDGIGVLPTEVSINDALENILYSLYKYYLNDGYDESEAIKLVYFYWLNDGISPIIAGEYMDYDLYLTHKSEISRIVLVGAYAYLYCLEEKNTLEQEILDYINRVGVFPQDKDFGLRIFLMFMKYLELKKVNDLPRC